MIQTDIDAIRSVLDRASLEEAPELLLVLADAIEEAGDDELAQSVRAVADWAGLSGFGVPAQPSFYPNAHHGGDWYWFRSSPGDAHSGLPPSIAADIFDCLPGDGSGCFPSLSAAYLALAEALTD